jgi:uncharacterized protein YndB with AHSA1/START domain
MGEKIKVTTPSEREIRVEREFNATPEQLYEAMTDPNLVSKWWGRGNKLVVEKMEVEKGGHWRFVEHAPEGVFGFEGRFRELSPPNHIEQTFEWDGEPGHVSVDTADFESVGEHRTKLINTSLFHTVQERDTMLNLMQDGLQASYDALDRLLAAA